MMQTLELDACMGKLVSLSFDQRIFFLRRFHSFVASWLRMDLCHDLVRSSVQLNGFFGGWGSAIRNDKRINHQIHDTKVNCVRETKGARKSEIWPPFVFTVFNVYAENLNKIPRNERGQCL